MARPKKQPAHIHQQVSITLPPAVLRWAKRAAKSHDSFSAYIKSLIMEKQ